MTMGTKEVFLAARPGPGPSAMVPCLPVVHLLGMALPTKPVGFLEGNQPAVGQVKLIPVFCVMAVQAPSAFIRMIEIHGVMKIHYTRVRIDIVFRIVAIRTGENTVRKRRRRNSDQFFLLHSSRFGVISHLRGSAGQKYHGDWKTQEQASFMQ